MAVCICRRHCQRAAGNIHCCAADNIPDRPERSDRAAPDGDRVGVGALSAAGNAHRFFCLQRAAFQRKVRRGRQLDAAVRQLTAAGEFVLNGQRAAVLHLHMIIRITAVTVSTLAKAQRIAVQADRNIAANREVMRHRHRLRQIVVSCRQRGVGVLELFVGRTVVLVLSCQFQRKGLGRCVILYCIVRVSGRYGGGQVFRHIFRKHTRRLHDDLHARRCVALFQHSHFGICAEINGAVCHLHVALCGEAGVLVANANGVIAGVGPIGAACQNHRTAIEHDNVFLQILCGGSAGNRQLAAVHNDLSVAGGFHVRQVHVACVVQHHAVQNKAVAPHGHSAAVVDQSIFRARAKLRVIDALPGIELKRAVRLNPDHRFRVGRGEDNIAVLLLHTFHAAASYHNGRAVRSGSAAGDPRDLHLAAGYIDSLFVAHGGERACQPRRTRRVGEYRTCTVVDHGDLLDVHRTAVDDGGRGAVISHSAEAFISIDTALVMAAPSQRAGIHNSRFAAAVHVDAIIIIVINARTRLRPSDFPQLQRTVVHNLTIDGALGRVPLGLRLQIQRAALFHCNVAGHIELVQTKGDVRAVGNGDVARPVLRGIVLVRAGPFAAALHQRCIALALMIQAGHDGHLTVIAEAQLAGAGGDFALQRRAGRIRDQVARALTADIDLCVIAQIVNIELLTVFQMEVGDRRAAADGNLSGRRRRYRAGHLSVSQGDVVRGDRAAHRGSCQGGLVGGNTNAAGAAVANALNGGVCRDDLLEVLDRANGRVRHGQGMLVCAANSHTGQVTVCKRILAIPVPAEVIIRLLYVDIFHVI